MTYIAIYVSYAELYGKDMKFVLNWNTYIEKHVCHIWYMYGNIYEMSANFICTIYETYMYHIWDVYVNIRLNICNMYDTYMSTYIYHICRNVCYHICWTYLMEYFRVEVFSRSRRKSTALLRPKRFKLGQTPSSGRIIISHSTGRY